MLEGTAEAEQNMAGEGSAQLRKSFPAQRVSGTLRDAGSLVSR